MPTPARKGSTNLASLPPGVPGSPNSLSGGNGPLNGTAPLNGNGNGHHSNGALNGNGALSGNGSLNGSVHNGNGLLGNGAAAWRR